MYNYEWFITWLKRNIQKPKEPDFNTQAKYIAANFTRCYFEVTESEVEAALKFLRFDYVLIDNNIYFSVDRSSEGFKIFLKHWD